MNKISLGNTNHPNNCFKVRDYMAWSWIYCANWFSTNSNSDLDLWTWKAIPSKQFGQGNPVWSLS